MDISNLHPQVGLHKTTLANTKQASTVTFFDESPAYETSYQANEDPSRLGTYDEELDFHNFFSRPVIIQEYDWTIGASLDAIFNPWTDWMRNPRIANRLSNYRNFVGNLKLKVVINGNGFYWGSGLLSYYPYPDPPSWWLHYTQPTFTGDLMRATQRPHILLDPTLSQGGEMELPFFWPQDCFNLVQGNPDDLGQCWLTSLTTLHHATTSNPVNIKIFAWCDNVKLSSPTQFNISGLLPQAGEVDDEYAKGPISKRAAIVEKVAGKLQNLPIIGPYAMASQIGANALGRMASMFGYCKPRQIENPVLMRLAQAGDLACIDSFDTNHTLGFNSKREVTVDPGTAGVSNVDELSLKVLAAKPSWTIAVPWAPADAVNKILFSIPVTPMVNSRQARVLPASNQSNSLTPCGLVALPFGYWRATMKYRFQLVASAYHRGRILIVWDPVTANGIPQIQTVRSEIIDISTERDFSLEVGWGVDEPALSTGGMPSSTTWTTAGPAVALNGQHNGALTVYVLNELTDSSGSTDPVYLNVFISSDDIEVWNPVSDNFNRYTYVRQSPAALQAQAGVVSTDQVVATGDVNTPDGEANIDELGGEMVSTASSFLHGDPICNFRTLLKRFNFLEVVTNVVSTPGEYCWQEIRRNAHPLYRGSSISGTEWSGILTLRALLSGCFAGWRGGMRYKFYPHGKLEGALFAVGREPESIHGTFDRTYVRSDSNLTAAFALHDNSFAGKTYSTIPQGHVAEIELPYYAKKRWVRTYVTPLTSSEALGYRMDFMGADELDFSCVTHEAVADDFNLFMFRGVPDLYFLSILPS
ncbi:hypothetical protein 2 [Wenzhou picorna-like virus 53]|uniref:hypothetical protein 2 n=1 Tax=Wenzhou picorna-like virus 53 TaxID=1923641 RepID=UPI00090AFFC3|nr:hypothetical protein 2 [Wenzhou picorna-like virus 53]APG78579.1 hypothetical protein 2 [Wenzhou picorna-like virus 53]